MAEVLGKLFANSDEPRPPTYLAKPSEQPEQPPQEPRRQRRQRIDRYVRVRQRTAQRVARREHPATALRAEQLAHQRDFPQQCVEEICRHDRPLQVDRLGIQVEPSFRGQPERLAERPSVGQLKRAVGQPERCHQSGEAQARTLQHLHQTVQCHRL